MQDEEPLKETSINDQNKFHLRSIHLERVILIMLIMNKRMIFLQLLRKNDPVVSRADDHKKPSTLRADSGHFFNVKNEKIEPD